MKNQITNHSEIINLYQDGLSSWKVAELTNCSQNSVLRILKKFDIESKPSNSYRKHNFDTTYFENIDTEDKAYFLGLLYADGCNFIKNGNVCLGLGEQDIHILEDFKRHIQYTGEIKIIEITHKMKSKMCDLRINSKHLSMQLTNLGISSPKSLTLKFPTEEQVPNYLIHHFIRGFFDGDGYISKGRSLPVFSITTTLQFLEKTQDILMKECGLNQTKISRTNGDNKNTYTMTYTGSHNCKRVRDYLYKDATVFLKRKHDIFFSINPIRKEKKNKFGKNVEPVPKQ